MSAEKKVTIYSKDRCNNCDQTENLMNKWGVPFEEVRADLDDAVREDLAGRGYMEMPVVRVEHPSGEVEEWSGFRYDRIKKLASEESLAA